jgi:hypothetical protein
LVDPQRVHLKRPPSNGTGVSGAKGRATGSMTVCRAHF